VSGHADPRAFTYAVGASLALHAVLLALRAPEPQSLPSVPSVTITAHIAEPEAAPPAAAPVEPKPEPKVEKPKPRPKVERPKPAPPAPSTFSVAPAPVEPTPPSSEPAPAPPVETIPGPVASAPPATPAPAAPDLSTLIAQYRSQFIGAAVRYKRYPLAARDNGWEGDVVVHLEVSANGELGELKVKKSSGHAVLDEQALEMFRLASPQVPLPAALRGRAFSFDVRAVYSLKD
jgi:protein TonB